MIGYFAFYQTIVREVALYHDHPVLFVEAGVRCGCSARIIRDALIYFKNWKLVLIDPGPEPEGYELEEDPRVELIVKPAQEIGDLIQDNSVDFLHIDVDVGGTHEYELNRDVYNALKPKLKENAVMIFHDCTDAFPGVQQIVKEICEEGWKAFYCPPAKECPIAAPVMLLRV